MTLACLVGPETEHTTLCPAGTNAFLLRNVAPASYLGGYHWQQVALMCAAEHRMCPVCVQEGTPIVLRLHLPREAAMDTGEALVLLAVPSHTPLEMLRQVVIRCSVGQQDEVRVSVCVCVCAGVRDWVMLHACMYYGPVSLA